MNNWRWIVDGPEVGEVNMARDEALLEAVGAGTSPPTLRFYQWSPPTISLGYFQSWAEYESLPHPAGELAVVRRQTGGGAILHDRELTYALVMPNDHPFLNENSPNQLYHHVHGVTAEVLANLGIETAKGPVGGRCSQRGPFFCFERHSCFDLLAGGRKIMGSAQRRNARAVLQHGSLILERRFDQQDCAAVADFVAAPTCVDIIQPLAAGILGQDHGEPGQWRPAERARATELVAKYTGDKWLHKR